ncbi:MAG: UDP-N-acetylmuramoyl-tripeptide--D-alanyl-D-alanine ligase, partial [Pseudomonadota bacterium]|nr:UDP-N-acetylmuramoyl-tripeptide--D-alanyl-D-alanine ligase [Pseudomonadota bacterium]
GCGAVAAMTSHELALDMPTLVVSDTTESLGKLAAHWRGQFDLPVVAVTGSNGKTTVREMITLILQQAGPVLAPEKNFNNQIGMPVTLLRLRAEHSFAVLELGMNQAGEIDYLTRIARPSVAVITNAASAHLEGLRDLTGVARAKAEILGGLQRSGVVMINADDRFAAYWLARARHFRSVTFGLDSHADVMGDVTSVDGKMLVEVTLPDDRVEIMLGLLGRHNARNALAAAAAAWSMGCTTEQIRTGLEKMKPVHRRLEQITAPFGARLIDDTYNANPASVQAAISVLAARSGSRMLVLGDMAELGKDARNFHQTAGRHAREAGIEHLLTTGDLARCAAEEFGSAACHFEKQEYLIAALRELLAPELTVLVKGSLSSHMENVVDALTQPTAA